MGVVGSTTPRPLLCTPLQLFFKNQATTAAFQETHDILKYWWSNGAPLALTLESFSQLLGIEGSHDAEAWFKQFDTDMNQKVDALEVLAMAIMLGAGTLDDKLEMFFSVFDFSAAGKLSFDEVSIFLLSLATGLHKVCESPLFEEDAIEEACQLMFDAHNVDYQKQITRDQIRRFCQHNDEAKDYVNTLMQACIIREKLEDLKLWEASEIDVFRQVAGTGDTVGVGLLKRNQRLQQALRAPNQDAFGFLMEAIVTEPSTIVTTGRFAEAIPAWNAFLTVDDVGRGRVKAADLKLLLWLFNKEQPTEDVLEKMRAKLELLDDDSEANVSLLGWLTTTLSEE
eukprot:TRINITY_DN21556_c0_g1_i2.p1 TRINITY_DN21556_c0_g1~~TRINITY_DN21556_c0_g1_i2.p1  ORF type:complete len:340 (-),score=95.91 TRINITY_DN21556_c0_g1_i2:157-1176(-)